MKDKPDYCYSSGCPLAETGTGFVLGTGDPKKAKLAVILEAPGRDETAFQLTANPKRNFLQTQAQVDAELKRRREAYIDVPLEMLKRGAPIVGASGTMLNMWVFPPTGIQRDEIFVDNVLRCLPPRGKKDKNYPIGEERHQAEMCCRHWDRLEEFAPTAAVMTMHPASVLREVTPLPLIIRDVEKAKSFTQHGHKVILTMGGIAAKAFIRYGDNITRWRGSYELLEKGWYKRLISTFFSGAFKKAAKKLGKGKILKKAMEEMNPAELTEHLLDVTPKKVRKRRRKKDGETGNDVLVASGDSGKAGEVFGEHQGT